jgi:hypothetical protein
VESKQDIQDVVEWIYLRREISPRFGVLFLAQALEVNELSSSMSERLLDLDHSVPITYWFALGRTALVHHRSRLLERVQEIPELHAFCRTCGVPIVPCFLEYLYLSQYVLYYDVGEEARLEIAGWVRLEGWEEEHVLVALEDGVVPSERLWEYLGWWRAQQKKAPPQSTLGLEGMTQRSPLEPAVVQEGTGEPEEDTTVVYAPTQESYSGFGEMTLRLLHELAEQQTREPRLGEGTDTSSAGMGSQTKEWHPEWQERDGGHVIDAPSDPTRTLSSDTLHPTQPISAVDTDHVLQQVSSKLESYQRSVTSLRALPPTPGNRPSAFDVYQDSQDPTHSSRSSLPHHVVQEPRKRIPRTLDLEKQDKRRWTVDESWVQPKRFSFFSFL